ncbi:glutamate--tRNA ligase family protein [Desulfopila aestuarii]|uniref:Glutamyl-tRNA synthetase n=1 Tax=Desulfopila aestuarii DSM 18488 TaxID=1121416 RepID=A0A1M7YM37_9BACT|nr:glutamate--tRNA ligase family protein [Desulfopila aestuarii]SHO53681.1 glutamyl-tRNA synthetase [Desulfopila aestuarii DSM 18488]
MEQNPVISRLAPTPSGYLHLGNALNFLITWQFVRQHRGKLILRIDDGDSTRSRPQFVEDIFRTLEWLELDWDLGPSGPDDFYTNYSQNSHSEKYFAVIEHLERTYSCKCSRKIIRKTFGSTIYGGSCRDKMVPFVKGRTAKRVIVDRPVYDAGSAFDLARAMGDFVLWTRDDTPAYQLVSLVEDETHGVTHIFRGEDLHTSTLAQKYLAEELDFSQFLQAQVVHHELIYGPDGIKLTKSAGAASLRDIRESGKDKSYVIDLLCPYLDRFREKLLP